MSLSFNRVGVIKATTFAPKDNKQQGVNEPDHSIGLGNDFVSPRFDPEFWMSQAELNTRLFRCIDTRARNAVGLGIHACICERRKKRILSSPSGRNKLAQAERDKELLEDLLEMPNLEGQSITEVFYNVEYDIGGSGNGYLEIIERSPDNDRVAGGELVGLLHIPCSRVRVSAQRDRYVRVMRSSTVSRKFFRRFGDSNPDHRYINWQTGQFYRIWPTDLPQDLQGTSILHVKNYCPLDDYYGQPPALTAGLASIGNKYQAMWNVNLLQNNAHIPFAIVVENGNLHPDSKEEIEAFTNREGTGINNAGKVLILEPDMAKIGAQGNLKIRLEPLKQTISDDGSFLKYRKANDNEIREAFGLSNVLIGVDDGGSRATAKASKQTSIEQAIEPRTKTWEALINRILLKDFGSGNGYATVKFRRPTALGPLEKATVLQKLKDVMSIEQVLSQAQGILQDPNLEVVELTNFRKQELSKLPLMVASNLVREDTTATPTIAGPNKTPGSFTDKKSSKPAVLADGEGRVVATTKLFITPDGQVRLEDVYE